jgi:hypothetical protein
MPGLLTHLTQPHMRRRVTLDCKAHLASNHALFHLWSQLDCRRGQEPGNRLYVLTADCARHGGAPCEILADVEPNKNEETVTLRLPETSNSLLP